MKQKMRIKVSANSEKTRKKAMQVAVGAKGVTSVAIEGEIKDKLVVVGDGVDATCLVNVLRKKACHAVLEVLEEVKQKPHVVEKSVSLTQCSVPVHCCIGQCHFVSHEQPLPEKYKIVYDSYGSNNGCKIM